jgi:hypothetical protein
MSIDVSEATNAIQHGSTGLYRRMVPVPGSVSARRPPDHGAPSDDDLMRMQAEGDPDAFGALFSRHQDQLPARPVLGAHGWPCPSAGERSHTASAAWTWDSVSPSPNGAVRI